MSSANATRPIAVCRNCGVEFRYKPSRKSQFCGKQCYISWVSAPLGVRFLRHLSGPTDTGCIEWTAKRNHNGYGIMLVTGSGDKKILTHRVAWEIANGPIPAGMYVLHRCDNPPCVNIEHLFLGTLADNNRDKYEKGRCPRGERCGKSNLTDDDIREIRRLYETGSLSQQAIAEQFGIVQQSVHKIVAHKRWTHVT